MDRLRKLLPFFIFLKACGSQDYGEPDKVAPVVVNHQEWREDALELQGHPASVFFGSADGCEPDTICVRSNYFGRYQMQELADRYPEHFVYRETEDVSEGVFLSHNRYVLEADLLVLEKSERLVLCGNENIVVTSEGSGGGEISGTAELCKRKEGAPLKLIAPDIFDLKFSSHGLSGKNGTQIETAKSEEKASDGNPNALALNLLEERTPTRLCITKGSCGKDRDLRERNLDYLESLSLYTRQQFRKWVHSDILKGTTAWPETNEFEYYPDFHCWFEALENEETTGLLESVSASLLGTNALNGHDAEKIWPGMNGQDGGNAGDIEVVTIDQKETNYVADAKGGQPGLGSQAIAQEPGEGVGPVRTSWTETIESNYKIFCKGKIEKSWHHTKNGTTESGSISITTPGSSDFIAKIRKVTFKLGDLNKFSVTSGMTGELLAPADLFGKNGEEISAEELSGFHGKSGTRGLDSIPARPKVEEPKGLVARLVEICPTCEPPIVLEYRDYKNTGESDEK